MAKTYYREITSNNKKKEKVLDFFSYVFEIDNSDIKDVKVLYYEDKLEITEFKDGKKSKVYYSPLLCFEMLGLDENNNEVYLSFEINIDLKTLNSFNNGIEDITKYMQETETFIKKPNDTNSRFLDFYIPTNTNKDMFHKLTSFYVLKLEEDKFLFKLTIPSENVFTYFEINFKE